MKKKKICISITYIFLIILILLSFSLEWCLDNFGNIGLDEIVFTLNMPLKGTAVDYYYSYFFDVIMPTVVLGIIGISIYAIVCWISKKRKITFKVCFKKKSVNCSILPLVFHGKIWLAVIILWFGVLVNKADNNFGFFEFVRNRVQASNFIEDEYIKPSNVNITFPQEKRNLICIYIESAESSAQDIVNGGMLEENLIPELTMIAKDNISFSQSELIEGAAVAPASGWTMAALVAQTSGLPLKLYTYDDKVVDNSMKNYTSFLPGAESLGQILEKEGYTNFFMAGSDFTFGGRRDYFTQHGNYEIWDYITAVETGKINDEYKEGWGFEDQKLFEYAKEELLKLAQKDAPFNFSLLTVDTHTGGGYVCDLCPDIYEDDYYNVWRCESKQVYDFVEWIKQQDFYENTTIYIAGDHCSMEAGFLGEYKYDKYHGATDRKVYNAFVNSAVDPIKMKNRKFTTLDLFPTVLASIGVEIEGDRLGLGTNLFSEKATLAEEYGYEIMFDELNKKSNFYDENILYPN